MEMLKSLLESFAALFIAIDTIGLIPSFLFVTQGMKNKETKEVLRRSVYAAALVAAGFGVLGKLIFWVMGISAVDFQIAGGFLLLVFSVSFLMVNDKQKRMALSDIAVIPRAVPFIVRPVVMTMILILIGHKGVVVSIIAFAVNMALVVWILKRAKIITDLIGRNGIRTVSKVVDILLTVFAVMLIRKGLMSMFP